MGKSQAQIAAYQEKCSKIIALHNQGKTVREIVDLTGFVESAVRRNMRVMGLKINPDRHGKDPHNLSKRSRSSIIPEVYIDWQLAFKRAEYYLKHCPNAARNCSFLE